MTGAVSIITAGTDDIAALQHLVESAYRGDSARRGWTHEADLLGGQRTDHEALLTIICDARQRMLLAYLDQGLVGCVNIAALTATHSYLGMLAVDPDRQGAGIGSKLITAAEIGVVSAFGATSIEMTVIARRTDLVAYYERRGYVRTGKTKPFPYDDHRFGEAQSRDLDFIVLRKVLI